MTTTPAARARDEAVPTAEPAAAPVAERAPDRPLEGLVVLITGAGSGLGRATAIDLGAAGMRVVAADLQACSAEETAAAIEGAGGDAIAVPLDVTSDENARDAIETTTSLFGGLDVLINNAGIDVTKPFDEIDGETWDRVLEVNLHAPARMVRAALPALRRSQRGHVIGIASTAALRGWTEASAYHASKWGLRGLGQALFTELRRDGIRVTTVIAGGMQTPFILDRFPDVPLDVLQDPANVASAIRFCLSMPPETVVAEILVLPRNETSWP
jgi:NAD(P)-dependent dehydrogenase (short-subunit alcohol dehydrogenase family)